MQIAVFEPLNFSSDALATLRAIAPVTLIDDANRSTTLAEASVLFVRLGTMIDAAFLRQAPRLRIICSPTTGHTHLDTAALTERGVAVLSLRGENEFLETVRATPEHTLGLMLALIRNYRSAIITPSNQHWDRDRCRGEELFGMPVGLIGYGRVGRRLAAYLDALGANVFWYDIADISGGSDHQRVKTVAELIDKSRMIVMAASCQDGAPPILGLTELTAMQDKYFVNTARGELVDENALLDLIDAGHFAGCAIDVIAGEAGQSQRDRWFKASGRNDLVLTPHIAGATTTSMARTEYFIAEKLRRHLLANKLAG